MEVNNDYGGFVKTAQPGRLQNQLPNINCLHGWLGIKYRFLVNPLIAYLFPNNHTCVYIIYIGINTMYKVTTYK